MIGAFEKKVSGNAWLWQEVPMSRGEGMIEHVALDANTAEYLGYAVHEDWQNTVWALSNTSAVVVERYEQDDPFGKSHTLDASGNNLGNFASQVHHHKRMHGGVVEEVTGLYGFRNRWYSPQSGAWLSRDPLGYVDAQNLYQFALLAPGHKTDVFGLSSSRGWVRCLNYGNPVWGILLPDFKHGGGECWGVEYHRAWRECYYGENGYMARFIHKLVADQAISIYVPTAKIAGVVNKGLGLLTAGKDIGEGLTKLDGVGEAGKAYCSCLVRAFNRASDRCGWKNGPGIMTFNIVDGRDVINTALESPVPVRGSPKSPVVEPRGQHQPSHIWAGAAHQ